MPTQSRGHGTRYRVSPTREQGSIPARSGFTLVELLVAAAVSMLLMVILTEAFKRGTEMFRTLRAQGQMMERLRIGTIAMRDDLASFHFYDAFSTDKLYLNGQRADLVTYTPPTDGFFRIIQWNDPNTGVPFVAEGTDREGNLFTRCTTHALHFTVFRRETSPTVGNNFPVEPSYLFRVLEPDRPAVPPGPNPVFPRDYIDPPNLQEAGIFGSRWAEVAYFLRPNGNTAGGTQLFNLYRRTKAVLPPPNIPLGISNVTPRAVGAGFQENLEISTRSNVTAPIGRFYNFSGSVTQPRNRMCMGPAQDSEDPYIAGLFCPFIPVPTVPLVPPPPGGPGPKPGPNYWPLDQDLAAMGRPDAEAGDDVLISDVISFEVKATWDVPAFPANIIQQQQQLNAGIHPNTPALAPSQTLVVPGIGTPGNVYFNTDYPFDYIPLSPSNYVLANRGLRVYDTWSNQNNTPYSQRIRGPYPPNPPPRGNPRPGGKPAWQDLDNNATTPPPSPAPPQELTGARMPLRIRVKAVLIRIRIWDAKAEQTRQITIIQDL